MRETRRVYINLVTRADYVDHFSQALDVIKGTVNRLHEEVQELRELINLLAELAADDTVGQDIDRASAEPPAPPVSSPAPTVPSSPAIAVELPVAQPVQHARRLSNREQLALARQRARDWAARELTRSNNRHHSA
jgi:hypothetical protein